MRLAIVIIITFIVLLYGATNVDAIIKSCCDVAVKDRSYFSSPSTRSGVYTMVDLCSHGPLIQGYCDAFTDGGGWLVIQRRQHPGREDFNRFWSEYERGFGNLYSEFWYGLRSLHCLTNRGTWELRIDITYSNGTKSHLHYNYFRVGSPTAKYQLSISGFTGYGGDDPFVTHSLNGQCFSTRDRDSDQSSGSCAINAHGSTAPGGWWYNNCFHINLNYNFGGRSGFIRLRSSWLNPTFIEMKIRPTHGDCGP